MKKINSILAITLSFVLLASCSKEKINVNECENNNGNGNGNNNTIPPSLFRIKTWSNSSSQRTYLYNSESKLVEVSSNTGSKETFDYTAGKIIKKQFNTAGINDFTAEYDLNESGLGITEKRPSQPLFTGTSIYNEQKQPVKRIYNINGAVQTQDYFYHNGNCDSIRFLENGILKYTQQFTYYTDKFNHLSNEAYGYPFFGKESKNLQKAVQFVYPNGSITGTTTFTYEFDEKGRPIKETLTQGTNLYINYISYY